jgi:hypothetical protein
MTGIGTGKEPNPNPEYLRRQNICQAIDRALQSATPGSDLQRVLESISPGDEPYVVQQITNGSALTQPEHPAIALLKLQIREQAVARELLVAEVMKLQLQTRELSRRLVDENKAYRDVEDRNHDLREQANNLKSSLNDTKRNRDALKSVVDTFLGEAKLVDKALPARSKRRIADYQSFALQLNRAVYELRTQSKLLA